MVIRTHYRNIGKKTRDHPSICEAN